MAAAVGVYAPFWPRTGAFALDYVVVILATALLKGLFGIRPGATTAAAQVFFWITVLLLWLYKAAMERSARQATLGKLAFDLKVTDLSGERIRLWRALARNFAQLLSGAIACIGFLLPTVTRRSQALHDMVAGTLVTRREFPPAAIAAAATNSRLRVNAVVPASVHPAAPAAVRPGVRDAPPRTEAQSTGSRPELPLRLSFRDALLGPGKRAVLQNLSDGALEVLLDVQSPLTGAHFRRTFVINPRCYGQIGPTQGWPFAPGQVVTVSNPRYRPMVRTVS